MFYPTTTQSESVTTTIKNPHTQTTTTTLLHNHLLIAGGNVGQRDLSTAELNDVPGQTFFYTGYLKTTHNKHITILLPYNNQILITNNTISFLPTSSSYLYSYYTYLFSHSSTSISPALNLSLLGALLPYYLSLIFFILPHQSYYFIYSTFKTDRAYYLPVQSSLSASLAVNLSNTYLLLSSNIHTPTTIFLTLPSPTITSTSLTINSIIFISIFIITSSLFFFLPLLSLLHYLFTHSPTSTLTSLSLSSTHLLLFL